MSQAPGACGYHCCFSPSFSSRMLRPTSRTNKQISSYVHMVTPFSFQRENTHHLNHASAAEKHCSSHICSCFSLNPAQSTTPWLLGRCSSAVTSTSRQMRINQKNPEKRSKPPAKNTSSLSECVDCGRPRAPWLLFGSLPPHTSSQLTSRPICHTCACRLTLTQAH